VVRDRQSLGADQSLIIAAYRSALCLIEDRHRAQSTLEMMFHQGGRQQVDLAGSGTDRFGYFTDPATTENS